MCEVVGADRFKQGIVLSMVGPGDQARPPNQARAHVAHHVTIQVGHQHHVELLGPRHQLTQGGACLVISGTNPTVFCYFEFAMATCMVALSTMMLSNAMSG